MSRYSSRRPARPRRAPSLAGLFALALRWPRMGPAARKHFPQTSAPIANIPAVLTSADGGRVGNRQMRLTRCTFPGAATASSASDWSRSARWPAAAALPAGAWPGRHPRLRHANPVSSNKPDYCALPLSRHRHRSGIRTGAHPLGRWLAVHHPSRSRCLDFPCLQCGPSMTRPRHAFHVNGRIDPCGAARWCAASMFGPSAKRARSNDLLRLARRLSVRAAA